jgi:histidinol phosphatase-like enzyme
LITKSLLQGSLVIAVDFDGTISTDPNMAKFEDLRLQPECKRVLFRLWDSGTRMILWTCRTGAVYDEALNFLLANGILQYFEAFNDQLADIKDKYHPNISRKVGADVYIDDKNIGTVIDWLEIEKQIFGEE